MVTSLQATIDDKLEELLNQAVAKTVPVDTFLASLRDQTEHTALYWIFIERVYVLAAQQGIFLNAGAFVKLLSRECRIDSEGIIPAPSSEQKKDVLMIGENQAFYLGTVGKILHQMNMTRSLRALVIQVTGDDAHLLEAGFIERTPNADFETVFEEELSELYGDEQYISIPQ